MFNSIHTCYNNKTVVTELTRKLSLGTENVVARIAISISIASGKKLQLNEIKDSKGKEYNKKVLFGENYPYYIALICQHYKINKSNKDIPKYIKMHIDDGLEIMNQEMLINQNVNSFEYIIAKIEKGLLLLFNEN
jgi:DNA sulfur modification protein DndE